MRHLFLASMIVLFGCAGSTHNAPPPDARSYAGEKLLAKIRKLSERGLLTPEAVRDVAGGDLTFQWFSETTIGPNTVFSRSRLWGLIRTARPWLTHFEFQQRTPSADQLLFFIDPEAVCIDAEMLTKAYGRGIETHVMKEEFSVKHQSHALVDWFSKTPSGASVSFLIRTECVGTVRVTGIKHPWVPSKNEIAQRAEFVESLRPYDSTVAKLASLGFQCAPADTIGRTTCLCPNQKASESCGYQVQVWNARSGNFSLTVSLR